MLFASVVIPDQANAMESHCVTVSDQLAKYSLLSRAIRALSSNTAVIVIGMAAARVLLACSMGPAVFNLSPSFCALRCPTDPARGQTFRQQGKFHPHA